jgi:hypothetical protein
MRSDQKQPYPDEFIYLNRSSKTRRFVMTPPTIEAEIRSEISPEDAFERITGIQAWLDERGIVPPEQPSESQEPDRHDRSGRR